jgi:ATP-dependent DNA helicase RecG
LKNDLNQIILTFGMYGQEGTQKAMKLGVKLIGSKSQTIGKKRMQKNEIKKMNETNRIEYKSALTKDLDLEKEVVAFLNYREGGLIYVGIDKTDKVLGVKDADGDMLKIKDRIKNNISPSAMGLFDVVAEERDEQEIIKIIVASGSEKPYFKKKYGMTKKGCYIRAGTAAEPMPQAMIDKLFAGRTRNSIGKIKAHRQDLSFEQLRIYYEEKKKPLNKQFKRNLELLTEDGSLNYAGYLLADENNVSIKVAKYSGTSRVDLIENNEYGYCSLIKATKSVLDKIDMENRTATTITSKERKEQRLWNAIALREAIINAFVHSDYTREIPPKFEIFADRIEITSAGSLPEGLSKEEFFEGYSIPRNKELMRVYKDLEMVEQLGSGIPRILETYGKECFYFSENFLRMVFPAIEKVTEQDGLVKGLVKGLVDGLVESQQQIIRLVLENPKISKREMAKKVGISTTAIDKNIASLKEKKFLKRVGSDRTGHWEVVKNEIH